MRLGNSNTLDYTCLTNRVTKTENQKDQISSLNDLQILNKFKMLKRSVGQESIKKPKDSIKKMLLADYDFDFKDNFLKDLVNTSSPIKEQFSNFEGTLITVIQRNQKMKLYLLNLLTTINRFFKLSLIFPNKYFY